MAEQDGIQPCPYCQTRAIETIATLPAVRGAGGALGAHFSTMTLTGCRHCVRKHLLVETLRSSLDGWGSVPAALANPVLLAYGLARAGIVRSEPERVQRMLEAAGLAEPPIRPVRIAYGLAASLICADGQVDQSEIDVASSIGKQVFSEFNDDDFLAAIAASADLPGPADLARVLNGLVDATTKDAVYKFLLAIAAADNRVVAEEQALLRSVAQNLGLERTGSGIDRSV